MFKMPGSRIGPYEILSTLGSGGMGEVYRARDSRLKREVAIKLLPPDFVDNPERQKRFQREAEAASALNHPNIMTVYDIGAEDGSTYMVSELIAGETLRKVLQRGSMPIKRCLDIAIQIANGLVAAHKAGIIHRDLKPENIMLTANNHVKILDFGLAKTIRTESLLTDANTISRALTATGVIQGTIPYMSPEQASGQTIDFHSDQFSFGLILYEMLTGKRPFARPTNVETLAAIIGENLPSFPAMDPPVPVPLRLTIQRCLAKDPSERFDSTADLQRDLSVIQSHLSELSVADSEHTQSTYSQTVKKGILMFLIASLIAITAVMIARQWGFMPKSETNIKSPLLERLTFRRGAIFGARFAPGGNNIVYSAAWDGNSSELYSGVLGSSEFRPMGLSGSQILSISKSGEMAILVRGRYLNPDYGMIGTLARVPFSGGTPRELVEDVVSADWAPDGKNLAIVRFAKQSVRLEFPIGRVLYESKPGFNCNQVRISPDGKRIAFVEGRELDYALSVLEVSGKKKTLSEGWNIVSGLAWSSSGDELFFAGSKGKFFAKNIYRLKLSGEQSVVLPLTAHLRFEDLSHDGRLLVSVHSDRAQMNVFRNGEQKEHDVSWFDWTQIRDLSHDGKLVLFNEIGEGTGGIKDRAYIRSIENPSAVYLAEANAFELSPDEKWVLAISSQNTPVASRELSLIPVGAGEIKILPRGPINEYGYATWFPDGKRIAFAGYQKNKGYRIYIQEIEGGLPVAITKEETQLQYFTRPVSPSGKSIVGVALDGTVRIFQIDNGESSVLSGVEKGNVEPGAETGYVDILRWTADGKGFYIKEGNDSPLMIQVLDPITGRKKDWQKLSPSDSAGVTFTLPPFLTFDGRSYGYSYERMLSDLYMIELPIPITSVRH